MSTLVLASVTQRDLRAAFGDRLKLAEPLARYTSARVGGPAEFLAVANSAGELAELVRAAWELGIDPLILGGGSNVLVADANMSDQLAYDIVKTLFDRKDDIVRVHAEGKNFDLKNQSESAAVIPYHPGTTSRSGNPCCGGRGMPFTS